MANDSHRMIAPKSFVNAHAQMPSRRQSDSSPILPTPVKHESTSSSTSINIARSFSLQSDARKADVEFSQRHRSPFSTSSLDLDGSLEVTSPSSSPRLGLGLDPRQRESTVSSSYISDASQKTSPNALRVHAPPSSPFGSGLKLKLRGIQAALKRPPDSLDPANNSSLLPDPCAGKRILSGVGFDDSGSDTDSEIDIMPPSRRITKSAPRRSAARTASRRAKKVKATHEDSDYEDKAMFGASDEDNSPTASPTALFDTKLILSSNVLKRSERMLDPKNPEHARLIAAAPKAGSEYYDSDADELPGNVKDTNKPHLFRNVKWGSLATDFSDTSVFNREPEFTQFVPGRYERLPNNTAFDQKHKLIIRLTDSQNRHRIFTNPPPLDWNCQAAITALNKRTVQQIRRNTSVRFREVVEPYLEIERQWILAHLENGKPTGGWRAFVEGFNAEFEGTTVEGAEGQRPRRSHSSLTKEVERFGSVYARGEVPMTGVKEKAAKRRGERKEQR